MLASDCCRQKAAESHSSFLSGFRFLSVEERSAITVLYVFCRESDDVVDGCADLNIAQITSDWWHSDLEKVFNNEMFEHPVHQTLKDIWASFNLPKNEFEALIDGMQMDLGQARYGSFDELKLYCHRITGVVGRLIAWILGFSNPKTLKYAGKMGLALQLANIIHDVGEDARRGRVYPPIEEMQKFDVPANVIMQCKPTGNFTKLMQFQVDRARETYREVILLLPAEDKKSQKVGLIMTTIYYTLLNEIGRDDAQNVLTYKIAIPSPRKKRIALKT